MTSASQAVRAQFDHPVIDTDGYVQEFMPAVRPYLRESLGAELFDRYVNAPSPLSMILGEGGEEGRMVAWIPQSDSWGLRVLRRADLRVGRGPDAHARELDAVSLEEGVWRLTGHPAEVYGIEGRGRVATRRDGVDLEGIRPGRLLRNGR